MNFKKTTIIVISLVSIAIIGTISIIGGFVLTILEKDQATPDVEVEHREYFRLVKEAVKTNDISICEKLPKPRNLITESIGDIWGYYPPQEDWIAYCSALVQNDILLCQEIKLRGNVQPYLYGQCLTTLRDRSNERIPIDNSLKDILPIQPTSSGDIPKFVEILREAKESGDNSLCESIPIPQKQIFDFGDYWNYSPSQNSWQTYCMSLVTENPLLCHEIDKSHPNLGQECRFVLEKLLKEKNNNHTFCYEQFGSLYRSSDEVRNCLKEFDLSTTSEFYQKLNQCMGLSDDPVYSDGPERAICLFEMAQETKDFKLCEMIGIPHESWQYSIPNCKNALDLKN